MEALGMLLILVGLILVSATYTDSTGELVGVILRG